MYCCVRLAGESVILVISYGRNDNDRTLASLVRDAIENDKLSVVVEALDQCRTS